MLGGFKAKGDFSRAEGEEKGVVRMLRRGSLRGFWKRGDVGKRKGVFWRYPKRRLCRRKTKAWGRSLEVSGGLAPREKEKTKLGREV